MINFFGTSPLVNPLDPYGSLAFLFATFKSFFMIPPLLSYSYIPGLFLAPLSAFRGGPVEARVAAIFPSEGPSPALFTRSAHTLIALHPYVLLFWGNDSYQVLKEGAARTAAIKEETSFEPAW